MKDLNKLNIIHRDLKKANILIKDGQIKIADFGFAKQLVESDLEINSIKCGTPSTMAPEILFSEGTFVKYNKKCDIWSIGIILHELVYQGKHPFDFNLENLIKFERVEDVGKKDFLTEDFLKKALILDPEKRMDWIEVFDHKINFVNFSLDIEKGLTFKDFSRFEQSF